MRMSETFKELEIITKDKNLLDEGSIKKLNDFKIKNTFEDIVRSLRNIKLAALKNLIDVSSDEIPKYKDDIVPEYKDGDNGIWNDIVAMDALYQYCKASDDDSVFTSVVNTLYKGNCKLLLEPVAGEFNTRIRNLTIDDNITYHVTPYIDEIYSEISDVIDLKEVVDRCYHSTLHAYTLWRGWRVNCLSDNANCVAPSNKLDIIEFKYGESDIEKLTQACTFAMICWRILQSIPVLTKVLSAEGIALDTLLATAKGAFEYTNTNIHSILMKMRNEMQESLHRDKHLEYANVLKYAGLIPILQHGPFVSFNKSSKDHVSLISEIAAFRKASSESYITKTKNGSVLTYMRLRAALDNNNEYNVTRNYQYYALKIGGSRIFNGVSILARSTSKIVEENMFKDQYPLFTFGPFNQLFLPSSTNEQVAEACQYDVTSTLRDNHDVVILGFGVSGAGKTSTLAWLEQLNKELEVIRSEPGLIFYWLNALNVNVGEMSVDVREFMPAHKEGKQQVSSKSDFKDMKQLSMFIVDKINARHRVKSTPNNRSSSRSHIAVSINLGENMGKLHLLDLAGSESEFKAAEMADSMHKNDELHERKIGFYGNVLENVFDWPAHWQGNFAVYKLKAAQIVGYVNLSIQPLLTNSKAAPDSAKSLKQHETIVANMRTALQNIVCYEYDINNVKELPSITMEYLSKVKSFSAFMNPDKTYVTMFQCMKGPSPELSISTLDTTVKAILNAYIKSNASPDYADFKVRLKVITRLVTAAVHLKKQNIRFDVWKDYLYYILFLSSKQVKSVTDNFQKIIEIVEGASDDAKSRLDNVFVSKTKNLEVTINDYFRDHREMDYSASRTYDKNINFLYPKKMMDECIEWITFGHVSVLPNKKAAHTAAVKVMFDKLYWLCSNINIDVKDDSEYTSLSEIISKYFTFHYFSCFNLATEHGDKLKAYTSDRNAEGRYINETLIEIQDRLLYASKETLGNGVPDFVDMCGEFGCHPMAPVSPCFQPGTNHYKTCTVLDALNFKKDTKTIIMGVVDIGKNSKDPVTWFYDGNLRFFEQIHNALHPPNTDDTVPNPEVDVIYKSVNLLMPDGTRYTSSDAFDTLFKKQFNKHEKFKLKLASRDNIVTKSTQLRNAFQLHNQSTVVGISQFIDTMGKLGTVVPCMRFVSNEDMKSFSMEGVDVRLVDNNLVN